MIEFDPNNLKPWIEYFLPLVEQEIDERLVTILKLRNGFLDGINHSYKSIGLSIKSRSNSPFKKNDHLSTTRAKYLYDVAFRKLMFYASRYREKNCEHIKVSLKDENSNYYQCEKCGVFLEDA